MATLPQSRGLSAVAITIDWAGPFAGMDFIPDQSPANIPKGVAGVYVQVIPLAGGGIAATYAGKSLSCMLARQQEHFQAVLEGKYNLVAPDGTLSFRARSPKPANYEDLVVAHYSNMRVFFGSISSQAGAPRDTLIDAAEGLLIGSPDRISACAIDLNGGRPTAHQLFQRLEALHSGAGEPVSLFGDRTVWDRSVWSIID
jgi:hypothetical protein